MFFLLVFLLIFSNSIYADLLELKTGESLEGSYVGESGKFLEFEVNGAVQKIPKARVKNLELGYKGSSFCYKTIEGEEDCNSKLFAIDDKKIVISKGKGGTIKEEIPLSKLEYFKSSLKQGEKLSLIIKPNSKLQIKSKKGELKGKVLSSDFQNGKVNLDTDKEGVTLEESEIEEIYWKKETSKISLKDFPEIAIPGIYQWPRNRILGGSMFILLLGFGAMIPTEFNKAQAALNEDQTIFIVNNRIFVLSGLGNNSKFEQHKRNVNIGILGVGLVFSYHIFDVIVTKNKEAQSLETRLEFKLTPREKISADIGSSEAQYSIQLTVQF